MRRFAAKHGSTRRTARVRRCTRTVLEKAAICPRWATLIASLVLVTVMASAARSGTDPALSAIALRIRAHMVAAAGGEIVASGERVRSEADVRRFYEARGHRPAWTDGRRFLPVAFALSRAIASARNHGLRPEDYLFGPLRARVAVHDLAQEWDCATLAGADILLTDAFISYGTHLAGGHTDSPGGVGKAGQPTRKPEVLGALERGLAKREIEEELEVLAPSQPHYRWLQEALETYRGFAAAGGWAPLPGNLVLKKGLTSPAVLSLRRRLQAEGYEVSTERPEFMDDRLEETVRRYQTRNGLEADGLVGPETRAALNLPAEERVAQIEANLERWRRRPEHGGRYVRVNLPDYRLEVVESGSVVLAMAVIVGRTGTPTPVFSAPMTQLVLNPSWNVPPGIASRELLKDVRDDVGYLSEHGFRVLQGWGANEVEVDPSGVDWETVSLNREGLRFQQMPGPANALGRLKFLFPNRFHVYLHDTPARGLFDSVRRDFSHGCVRVERPRELAEYLLRENSRWSPEEIRDVLERGDETAVRLDPPVPVHLEYFTAWADEDGSVHFRPDIYGLDAPVYAALRDTPPSG